MQCDEDIRQFYGLKIDTRRGKNNPKFLLGRRSEYLSSRSCGVLHGRKLEDCIQNDATLAYNDLEIKEKNIY